MKITRPITLLILFGIGYLTICSLLIHNYLIGEKTPFSVLLFFSLPAFTSIAIHRKGHSNPTAHAFYVIKKPMLIITTGGFFITLLIGFITGMVKFTGKHILPIPTWSGIHHNMEKRLVSIGIS